jgi:hypothetical protein
MSGPEDWGARPVDEGGPETWGARPVEPEQPPQPFLDRIARGDALSRAIAPFTAAIKGFGENFGSEPLGLSEEHVQQLREAGVYADPATGRGGVLRFMNEAVGQQISVLGDIAARGASGVVGAVAGAVRQFVEDSETGSAGDYVGNAQRAENEVKNFGNYLLLRGDHEFGRVDHTPTGPADQPVGILPRDQDFTTGAKVLTGTQRDTLGKIADVAEQNLRDLWQERGIHPAEAVADARNDAFLRGDLVNPPFNLRDRSEIPPVRGSTVPEGTPRSELGRTGDPMVDRILDSDVTRHVIDSPIVDREHTIPYTAGGSVPLEDPTFFIDRRFPREFTVDGITFDPADPFSIHENTEQHAMMALIKGGMDSATAYKVAHFEIAEKAEGAWYAAHGIDQAKAEAAYAPIMAQIQHEGAGDVPPNLYKRPYPHDNPSAAIHEPIAEPKPTKAEIAQARAILDSAEATDSTFRAVGADVTRDMPTLAEQPPVRPGSLLASAKAAADKLFDIGKDLQMLTAPMATGSNAARAIAKDFANSMRRNRWEWSRIDGDIAKRFDPEQRKRMWDAADEESVLRQEGKESEHMGLATLEPEERQAVEMLQARSQIAWLRAVDLGMVEGEGLPAYTPRMVMNVATAGERDSSLSLNAMGRNLRTRTAQMLHRANLTAEETEAAAKSVLGEGAQIARDIRTLPLATAKLEDAIAGRTLINAIKEYGKRTGDETVTEGAVPTDSPHRWFSMQEHPAFMQWRPKFDRETGKVVLDADGNTIFEKVPIYVRDDFEGPLRAVLSQKSGALYGAFMSLKGKTMGLIMNSPLIHNAVEWGRAVPAMPGKVVTFRVYFEGNRVKNDPVQMREAIDAGLVPIGHRFFNQDISSIMEEPNLSPGRSWTAKILGAVPGLFDEGAGDAVKAAIDKAGDFWHNTLLWDRVGDLQAGLYANFRDSLLAKQVDRRTANIVAAHFANRFAGALPVETMSDGARKVSNFLMFSRTFTLGNLGVMKDMLTGLPKDVLAQLERDGGFSAGSIANADETSPAVSYAKSLARRKAMAVVATDIGLMIVGNSLLQSAFNVMRGDKTMDQEMHGYAERTSAALSNVKEHPAALLQPFDFLSRLSATNANEPGKQDRIKIGYAADGTAIYARNPVGKIGEEFEGYLTGPLDMIRRKMGTVARPAWQIMSNDAGFGRKIYDPNADTPAKYIANLGRIAAHLAESQIPEGQISAFSDLVKGQGDPTVNKLQAFGPVAGVTFSKGAPGGPAVGELYHAREMHDYAVQAQLPDIRKQFLNGDQDGARQAMTALGIPPGLQRYYSKVWANPATRLGGRTLKDFYLYGTDEQKQRLENAR